MFDYVFQRFPVLSVEDEKILCTDFFHSKNPNLRNRLVNHNLRLVLKITSEYPRLHRTDLFGEGCIGLIRGIEKFDPTRGLKLSTYVSYWIRAYVLSYIVNNARLVKLGTTQSQRKVFFNLHKAIGKLESLGQDITPEAIAEHLAVDGSLVAEMQQRMSGETRLDAQVRGKADSTSEIGKTRIDMMTCDGLTPDEALSSAQEQFRISQELSQFRNILRPKEQQVFDLRMLEAQTLQDVGDKLGVSRERIRQVEKKVEDKLKKFWKLRHIEA